MGKAVLKVFIFMLVLVGFFLYVGNTITRMTGGERKVVAAAGINPEAGEAIFFGKGKCSTCHSIGDRGSAIRCPNLGVYGERFTMPIGERAIERAKEREKMTGKKYTRVDYLIECLAEPPAYVVEGYKAEMPYVYKPPISLSLNEVKAVITFLMSQGGEVDLAGLNNPPGEGKVLIAKVEAATREGGEGGKETVAAPPIQGDPEKGKELFFDLNSHAGCAKCHTVAGQGGHVGPELTNVAGTRPLSYIMESIMSPSAVIASGFEPILIKTKEGQLISGVKKGEDETSIEVGLSTGEISKIPKADIDKSKMGEKSIMPGNFREILTVEEFYNVVAFLQTLT